MNAAQVIICGHTYTYSESDPGVWSNNGLGRSDIRTGKIEINAAIPNDTKHSTLLHEVIHQIFDLNDYLIKDNETLISVLAVSLFNFIKDNPTIINDIILHQESSLLE